MTVQATERIVYQNQEYILKTVPLKDYLENNGIDITEKFDQPISIVSCLWRGYIGHWLLEDGKLFLIKVRSFHGQLCDLDRLFCDYVKEPYFCEWFSGSLTIAKDYDSETVICVDVQNGRVLSEKTMQIEIQDDAIVLERLVAKIEEHKKSQKQYAWMRLGILIIVVSILIWIFN